MPSRERSVIALRLLGADELAQYLSVGKNKALEIAADAEATLKFGGRCLYDKNVIDSYLDALPHGR